MTTTSATTMTTRTRLFITLAVFTLVSFAGAFGTGLFGAWSATQNSAGTSAAGGVVALTNQGTLSTTVSNFAPGDTATRYIELNNANGNLGLSALTLGISGWATNLDSHTRLTLAYYNCTGTYAWNSGSPTCTGGNGGVWTNAVSPTNFLATAATTGSPISLVSGAFPAANAKTALKVVFGFCDTTNDPAKTAVGCTTEAVPSGLAGSSSTLTLTFTATQRASTSTL